MKSLDAIVVARAAEQVGSVDFKIERWKTYPCPEPDCKMRFSPQSKLKRCPVHSAAIYKKKNREAMARLRAAKKAAGK